MTDKTVSLRFNPAGCWLLAAGCWLLAAGCWLLAAGCFVSPYYPGCGVSRKPGLVSGSGSGGSGRG
ncbi:hypothetical protein CKO17_15695, partial [Marichromatium gracile]|nr:hypothetical protein [Marichromatium gracile]